MTSEYSQQAHPSKQLDTVNNRAQLNNKRTTKYTEQIQQYSQQPYRTGQLNTVNNC